MPVFPTGAPRKAPAARRDNTWNVSARGAQLRLCLGFLLHLPEGRLVFSVNNPVCTAVQAQRVNPSGSQTPAWPRVVSTDKAEA